MWPENEVTVWKCAFWMYEFTVNLLLKSPRSCTLYSTSPNKAIPGNEALWNKTLTSRPRPQILNGGHWSLKGQVCYLMYSYCRIVVVLVYVVCLSGLSISNTNSEGSGMTVVRTVSSSTHSVCRDYHSSADAFSSLLLTATDGWYKQWKAYGICVFLFLSSSYLWHNNVDLVLFSLFHFNPSTHGHRYKLFKKCHSSICSSFFGSLSMLKMLGIIYLPILWT